MRLLNSGKIGITLASLSVPGVLVLSIVPDFSSFGAGALWSSWMALFGYGLTGYWLVARCAGKARPSLMASLLSTIGPGSITLLHGWMIARQILWCTLLCLALRAMGVSESTVYYMLAVIFGIGITGATTSEGVARLASWHWVNLAGLVVVVVLMVFATDSVGIHLMPQKSDAFYWLVHDRPPFHWAAGLQSLAFGAIMGLVDPALITPILHGESQDAAKRGVAAGVIIGGLLTGFLFLGCAVVTHGSPASAMHFFLQDRVGTWVLLSWVCYSQGVYLAAQFVSLEPLIPIFPLFRGKLSRVLLLGLLIAALAMAGILSETLRNHIKDYYVLLITVDIPIISIFIFIWLWRPCTSYIFWFSLGAGIAAALSGHFLFQLSILQTALLSHLATTICYIAIQYITALVQQRGAGQTRQQASTPWLWITAREKSLRISSAAGILLISVGSAFTGFGILIGAPVAILGFVLLGSVFVAASRRTFFYRRRIDT